MRAVYDPRTLDQIAWAALRAPGTRFQVLYNEACTAPAFPPLIANVELVPTDWVPAGCVTVQMSDRPMAEEMLYVTGISFSGGTATIAYADTRIGAAGSAVTVPLGEEYADEVEVMRAHAGILAAQILREKA